MRATWLVRIGSVAIVALALSGCDFIARVTVDEDGGDPDGQSDEVSISADGRYVAFTSDAGDLVPNDTNGTSDVFVRDIRTGVTARVGVTDDGDEIPVWGSSNGDISGDGRRVAFYSVGNATAIDTNASGHVYVRDRQSGTTDFVDLGAGGVLPDGEAFTPAISADGRYVAFVSEADNLVPGDGTGTPFRDAFVRDLQTDTTKRVSIDLGGGDPNDSSGRAFVSDGSKYVAFSSHATDLVAGDTNDVNDVFVRDVPGGVTTLVSKGISGPANDESFATAITPDGRYVTFVSAASNLVPNDTNGAYDLFRWDRQTAAITRVDVTPAGGSSAGGIYIAGHGGMSGDGRYVTFLSEASDLVAGDTNGHVDLFVRDLQRNVTRLVSVSTSRELANGATSDSDLSGDGRYAAFSSQATNLLGGTSFAGDIFIRSVERPVIASITPNTAAPGTTTSVTLHGSGFLVGPAPLVGFGDGIHVDAATAVSETEVDVTITVAASAPPGPRSVSYAATGTGPGSRANSNSFCVNCFTVTP